MNKCPYCRKANPDEAKKCIFCSAALPEEKKEKPDEKKHDKGAKE